MNNGFIKLYKKMENWQWYKDSTTLHLFIDLLLDANYEDSKAGFEIIKRGQCLTSLKRMHERTGMTYQQIRTSLDKLKKTGEINKQTTNRYSIITIKKYNEYQEINKQTTNKQQTNNNIKEYKEEQEYKELNIKEKYIKRKYGQFENVKLTDEEYQKLKDKFNDYESKIENLSSYIASKGDKYKSHYATILNWAKKDKQELPEWFNNEPQRKEIDYERKKLAEAINNGTYKP